MWLAEIKTTDLESSKKYTFVIPLGATEQHGPFLPLGTDSFIQDAINNRVERKLKQVIFLPTLRITASEEHRGFAGTIWVRESTLYTMLKDICRSLEEHARNIILVSSHGGNIHTLDKFVEEEKKTFKPARLFHFRKENAAIIKKIEGFLEGPKDDHAGNVEISTMLAIDTSIVKKPDKKYPKLRMRLDWQNDYVIDKSRDGIVDNHPEWMISKKLGDVYLDLQADHLVRKIKSVL